MAKSVHFQEAGEGTSGWVGAASAWPCSPGIIWAAPLASVFRCLSWVTLTHETQAMLIPSCPCTFQRPHSRWIPHSCSTRSFNRKIFKQRSGNCNSEQSAVGKSRPGFGELWPSRISDGILPALTLRISSLYRYSLLGITKTM